MIQQEDEILAMQDFKLSATAEEILTVINRHGATTSKILCESFDVSRMTVYRALKQLEELDYITRNHGFITMKEVERDFSSKIHLQNEQKKKIAKWTVQNLIPQNMSIMLEAGTTVGFVLEYLAERHPAVILSNGLETLRLARYYLKDTDIFGAGGFLHHSQFVGSETVDFFAQHHAEIVLLSAAACSFELGYMDVNKLQCEIKHAMIQNADQCIMLLDSSKLNRLSVTKFADINSVNHLVTHTDADPKLIDKIRATGVQCHLVS